MGRQRLWRGVRKPQGLRSNVNALAAQEDGRQVHSQIPAWGNGDANDRPYICNRTHALPANSRLSVDTFTFSPSLMKRGTRISRPVSSRAVLVPPSDESPRTVGSV